MLSGTGTAGAYHAGVLRAFHEAGVKIDLVAGRGAGVGAAMLAAVDGDARLWGDKGIWRDRAAARFYGWRRSLRVAGAALVAAFAALVAPLAALVLAAVVYPVAFLLRVAGLAGGAALIAGYAELLDVLFQPAALPAVLPRLALVALSVCGLALVSGALGARRRAAGRRRDRASFVWRLVGAPIAARDAIGRHAGELWQLIRGVAPLAQPPAAELSRRYTDLLAENLGQPGFRELLLVAHDLDARRDLVFALLAEPHRRRFFARHHAGDASIDLAGVGNEHAYDALSAALCPPFLTDPHLVRFSPESYWRGETHRACDRPGALTRLLWELADAGVEQAIVVSATTESAAPHALSSGRLDPRGRAGEYLAAAEAAALRDALDAEPSRPLHVFSIAPAYNPLGPFDFAGCYDERSDRDLPLAELIDRGYEDAYRQFIEPVVAASGETLEVAGRDEG